MYSFPNNCSGEQRMIRKFGDRIRANRADRQARRNARWESRTGNQAQQEQREAGERFANPQIEAIKKSISARRDRLRSIYHKHRAENPKQWDSYWEGFKQRFNPHVEKWNTYAGSMTDTIHKLDAVLRGYEQKLLPLENTPRTEPRKPEAKSEPKKEPEEIPPPEEKKPEVKSKAKIELEKLLKAHSSIAKQLGVKSVHFRNINEGEVTSVTALIPRIQKILVGLTEDQKQVMKDVNISLGGSDDYTSGFTDIHMSLYVGDTKIKKLIQFILNNSDKAKNKKEEVPPSEKKPEPKKEPEEIPPPEEKKPQTKAEKREDGESLTNGQIEAIKKTLAARSSRLKTIYQKHRSADPTQWDNFWKEFVHRYDSHVAKWNTYPGSMTDTIQKLESVLQDYEKILLPLDNASPGQRRSQKPEVKRPATNIPEDWIQKPNREKIIQKLKDMGSSNYRIPVTHPPEKYLTAFEKAGKIAPLDVWKDYAYISLNDGTKWKFSKMIGHNMYILEADKNTDIKILIHGENLSSYTIMRDLEKYAGIAKTRYASETKDAANMKAYDIPEKDPLGYVEFVDRSDELIRSTESGMEVFSDALASKYNVVIPPNKKQLDLSIVESPTKAIHSHLQGLYKRGIRSFYINILAHGSENRFGFGKNKLPATEMVKIFKAFPDCKFVVNTIACYGGGVEKAFADFKDYKGAPKGRVTVFTQTKSDVPNLARSYKEYDAMDGKRKLLTNDTATTSYVTSLIHGLIYGGGKGKALTYGEAHLMADRNARKAAHTDAGVQTSNPEAAPDRTAENKRKRAIDEGMA